MLKLFIDSAETYLEAARLVLVFGFMVFAVMLFLIVSFTYVVGGAGFVRYSSLLAGEFSAVQLLVLALVGLISLFCLSFLAVAVTMVVKLKRSLDDIEFLKLISRFPKYLLKLMLWWLLLGAVTFFCMLVFNAVNAPPYLTAFLMLLLWAFFIFIPQSLVLHDKKFADALTDSASFCLKKPVAVLTYYVLSCILVFSLVLLDVLLGQFFITEETVFITTFINSGLLFIFFIPYLEIVKANVFLTRYPLLTLGLK
jgi:hypothetical protein